MRPLPWLAILVVPLLLVRAGVSAPLDPEACAKLKEEHNELVRKGAKANLAKGPDWGKANLTQTGLDDVRRLIEVEEQVQFRCFVPEPEPAKPATPKKAKAKAPAPAPDESNSAAKKAPKAGAAKTPGDTPAQPGQPSKAPADKDPKKQPKPKAKPNDAYVPPAK